MIIVNAILYLSSAWYSILSFNYIFFSLSCSIDLSQKITKIIENMIFSLIFVLRKIWYFRQLWKIKKTWCLRWAFLRKYCFSCSATHVQMDRPISRKGLLVVILAWLIFYLKDWDHFYIFFVDEPGSKKICILNFFLFLFLIFDVLSFWI